MPGHLAKSLAYDNDMRGRAGAYEVSRMCVFARVCLAPWILCVGNQCAYVFCRGVFSASRSGGCSAAARWVQGRSCAAVDDMARVMLLLLLLLSVRVCVCV